MYAIGARVQALWEGAWYSGTISQINGDQFFVQFDDGSNSWLAMHELQPVAGYAVGARIRRLWTDGNYYSGTVQEVAPGEIHVLFDDGDTAWLAPHEVEDEMPTGGMGGPGMQKGMGGPGMQKGMGGPGMQKGMGGPGMQKGMGGPGMQKGMGGPGMQKGMGGPGMQQGMAGGGMYNVGARVTAQWTDGGWYGATIGQVGPDSVFVTFDDGYTAWVQAHQIQLAGGGGGGMYAIGSRIQKQWTDGNWYGGTVAQLGDDGSLFVQFDDGDTAWVAPHEIQPLK